MSPATPVRSYRYWEHHRVHSAVNLLSIMLCPMVDPHQCRQTSGFEACAPSTTLVCLLPSFCLSACWQMSEPSSSHPYCWKCQSLVVSTVQLQGFRCQEPFRLSSKLVTVTSHSHFIFRSRDRVEIIALLCLMIYLYRLGPINIDMFGWVKI